MTIASSRRCCVGLKIDHLETYFPVNLVTNQDLHKDNPSWEMDKVESKTGVQQRYIAGANETSFDLAVAACEKLFEKAGYDKNLIDGIIFCTQTPDYIMPSNAFLLHKQLKLRQHVFAFDYNLACSGYIYGLAMAQGFIATTTARNVLLVTAETYSKLIHSKDRAARVLFGDGAAVTIVSNAVPPQGIIDIALATSGESYDTFYIPAGGARLPKSAATSEEQSDAGGNVRTLNDICMNGFSVWKFIQSVVPKQIREIVARNGMQLDDIDLFIFHQASKMTLDSLVKALKIDENKVFLNLAYIGNTVSASIPMALKDAVDQGVLQRGMTVLMCGFGVGLSWGTAIMKY